jgi:hypothetical protein
MLDVNGQSIGDGTLELVKFAETASAVNEITVTNSATGTAPEIAATGDDTNIDLKLTPKGTGKLNLDGIKFPNADGSAGQALTTDGSGVLSFSTISADGTADWDTTVKTTGFTATANKGYFCNTTSAEFTVTLPATPSAGDEVIIVDYAATFATNNLIITSTAKINGSDNDVKLTTNREATRLVYIDSTQGWLAYSGVNEGTAPSLTDSPPTYSIDFLVVAGGASGGGYYYGGGGGAGGYRTSTQSVAVGTVITVTVGDGGALVSTTSTKGNDGSNSSISGSGLTTITSTGGGGGGSDATGSPSSGFGKNGGSGGGNSGYNTTPVSSGNTPSTSPSQGNNGGQGGLYGGGGGGGAGAVGSNGTAPNGGDGGAGTASSITGSSVTRAGGGGGAAYSGNPGAGGTGGGGAGATTSGAGVAGTANTGGGGGGNSYYAFGSTNSGAGGKGVVILSMPDANYTGTTTGSPTVATGVSGKTVLTFNGSGSYTA